MRTVPAYIVTLFAISKIASLSVISKSAFPRIEFPRLKIAEPELAQGRVSIAAPSVLRSIFALSQYHYLSLALLSCLLSLFPCF